MLATAQNKFSGWCQQQPAAPGQRQTHPPLPWRQWISKHHRLTQIRRSWLSKLRLLLLPGRLL